MIQKETFLSLIIFSIKAKKAFFEFVKEGNNFIARADVAQIIRGFGDWSKYRAPLHNFASLFDYKNGPGPSKKYVFKNLKTFLIIF